jgi:peroxiredoxin/outer membrane lipoprotein-sorting protein
MRLRKFVFVLCCCLCSSMATRGDTATTDDATAVLSRVADTYRSLQNYHFQGTFTMVASVGGFSQRLEAPFVMAGKAPGKSLVVIDHEALGIRIVCDGEATWTYFASFRQYKKESSVPIGPGISELGGSGEAGPAQSSPGIFLSYYMGLDDGNVTPRRIGEQTIEEGGRGVSCEVIEVTYEPGDSVQQVTGPDTLWVDVKNALVVKSTHRIAGESQGMAMETVIGFDFDLTRTGNDPPDSLFVFVPPEGASLVEEFSMGARAKDLSGELAPHFSLVDLNGKTHELDDLEGKVVLIDFWATWCPPCRKELPTVEKLHREFGQKGLVVLAITSEPEKVAKSFVKKHNYTFTVLIDPDGGVFDKYLVSSIPVMFVVDREGRIAAHIIGFQGENKILEAARRAGVE